MPEPKVLSQPHDVSPEEKEILTELEANLQDFKAQKPTAKGYARYARRSRSLISKLSRIGEQRRIEREQRAVSKHLNDFDGVQAVHIHFIENGKCACGKVWNNQRKNTSL